MSLREAAPWLGCFMLRDLHVSSSSSRVLSSSTMNDGQQKNWKFFLGVPSAYFSCQSQLRDIGNLHPLSTTSICMWKNDWKSAQPSASFRSAGGAITITILFVHVVIYAPMFHAAWYRTLGIVHTFIRPKVVIGLTCSQNNREESDPEYMVNNSGPVKIYPAHLSIQG